MTHDDYRKALTSYGPHTADYMNTRLVRLAGELNGGPALEPETHDPAAQADEARQEAVATALGAASTAAYDAWLAALPDDVGPAEALTQPEDITRFDATTFSWRGGSNAVDNPVVSVERRDGERWVSIRRPDRARCRRCSTSRKGADGLSTPTPAARSGSGPQTSRRSTPPRPRSAARRPARTDSSLTATSAQDGADAPYHLESEPFEVKPWNGIEVTDMRLEPDVDQNDSVSFVVPPIVYPQTYESLFRYVGVEIKGDEVGKEFCTTCSFRPWALGSEVESATVTVVRKNGKLEYHEAELIDGRWVADTKLKLGEKAYVDAGGVIDGYGETNGERSTTLAGVKG